jgi:hypothetical protein
MTTNDPTASAPVNEPKSEEPRQKHRESVYKRGAYPPSSVDDFTGLASDFAELAADWAGAFAKGMRVFSQTLSDRPLRSAPHDDRRDDPRDDRRDDPRDSRDARDDRRENRREAADSLVRATTESAAAVLDELSKSARKTGDKLTRKE